MKKILVLSLMLTAASSLCAQISGQPISYTAGVGHATDGLYNYAMGSIADKNEKSTYKDDIILGSPYLSNTFNYADLYYGEESQGGIYFRYNAYNEEVEIREQNNDIEPIRALTKDKKIRLMVNNKPMSFKTFIDKKGNTKNGYLTLLNDGQYKLYHHLGVAFSEGKKAENSFVQAKRAKFSQKDEYYLEDISGKKISQIELNNKKVLDLVVSEHKKGLQNFLKSEKLKIKTVNDLNKVIDFLNTMK